MEVDLTGVDLMGVGFVGIDLVGVNRLGVPLLAHARNSCVALWLLLCCMLLLNSFSIFILQSLCKRLHGICTLSAVMCIPKEALVQI